jgi:hypothetical protein
MPAAVMSSRSRPEESELDGLIDRMVADLRATQARMGRGAPAAERAASGG